MWHFVRQVRIELATARVAFSFVVLALAGNQAWASGREPDVVTAVSVVEVGIAAPDVLAVEIREPTYKPGRLVQLPGEPGRKVGDWLQRDGEWGLVVGRNRDWLRIQDVAPTTSLNRGAVDVAKDYGQIGGRTVMAIYRKSMPWDSGIMRTASGATATYPSYKHSIYLKLNGPLPPGEHKIVWPAGTLPDTTFRHDPKTTRAVGLRINQNGYGAGDVARLAYLSLWLPGGPADGAVDFRLYGLDRFEVLDDTDTSVFGGRILVRKGPTDPEPGNGLGKPILEQPSASATAISIAGVNRVTPVRLLLPAGHGFSTGQRVWLRDFGGGLSGLNGAATVGAVTATSIELQGIDGRTLAAAASQVGTVAPVARLNRAGTYVFEIDFSAWKPTKPGRYRIFLPGLGSSDAFDVSDDVWARASRVSFGGLYNHRSGPALDGRFGFTRPPAFVPGSEPIRESRLPLAFIDNGGFIEFTDGASAPWLTDRPASQGAWGGYMDAGDYDRRIVHLEVSYLLMDLLEFVPQTASFKPGLPSSADVLDRSLYEGTRGGPEVLDEVLWNLDFYRRLQAPDGGVSGGIESGSHPTLGEPSFIQSHQTFVYAPDYVSSYRYASAAAKLSRILTAHGQPALAKLFRDSALAAWTYAEPRFAEPDAAFADALRIAVAANKIKMEAWPDRRAVIQKAAAEQRVAAAANLSRLTGEARFRSIVDTAWASGFEVYSQYGDAAWELAHDPNATPAQREAVREAFRKTVQYVLNGQDGSAYPALKHFYVPFGWGLGTVPDYNATQLLIRSHLFDGQDKVLRAMLAGSAHILGANQVGISLTTGLGYQNIRHPLHEDHRAMGVSVPPGITIYGWSAQSDFNFDWLFGPDWAPIPDNPALNKRIDPNRFTLPVFEYLVEHPLVVIQQEYTVHQTIGPTAAIWLYLHMMQRSAR